MRSIYSIWDDMRKMQEQMDMMFESFFGQDPFFRGSHELIASPNNREKGLVQTNYRQPLTDIHETDKEFIATIELPGVEKKDIQINATDEGIDIKVEKKEEKKDNDKKEGMYRLERSYTGFYRHIPTPDGVDVNKMNASYKNGVLELKMPKISAKKKAKQISIK